MDKLDAHRSRDVANATPLVHYCGALSNLRLSQLFNDPRHCTDDWPYRRFVDARMMNFLLPRSSLRPTSTSPYRANRTCVDIVFAAVLGLSTAPSITETANRGSILRALLTF